MEYISPENPFPQRIAPRLRHLRNHARGKQAMPPARPAFRSSENLRPSPQPAPARRWRNPNPAIHRRLAQRPLSPKSRTRFRRPHPQPCYAREAIKPLVDFIVSDEVLAVGKAERLERLYNELISKDWFTTLLDLENYIRMTYLPPSPHRLNEHMQVREY